MKRRSLFTELMQGVEDMAAHREGKITLRHHQVEELPEPHISAQEIVHLRKKLNMSQAVFARRIRTKPATLRNWEQAKASPNPQAALLIRLVERYPDMVERLTKV